MKQQSKKVREKKNKWQLGPYKKYNERTNREMNELPHKWMVCTEVFVLSASDNERAPSSPISFAMNKQEMQREVKN